ncbi:hypothetical protein BGX34_006387 [Mortierella sp. NVP85]|nr:hypothetical protein BGX34_006387 [Mortierella sp. NVP85]
MTDFVSITIVIAIIFMIFRWFSDHTLDTPTCRQIDTVRSMFPNIPVEAIQYDLQKTGSVEQTCENILRDGTLPLPPRPSRPAPATFTSPPTPTPTAGSSSGSSQSVNGNLIQRFRLQDAADKNWVPEEPSKVWGDNSEKRQEVFKSRKEFMVLQARKYVIDFYLMLITEDGVVKAGYRGSYNPNFHIPLLCLNRRYLEQQAKSQSEKAKEVDASA